MTNYAQYNDGVKATKEFLNPELATMPENNPREGSGAGVFVAVCVEPTQMAYDQIRTRLRS